MQKSRLIAWFEVAATVSVLIGLLLVAVELRQGNQHATAESTREIYQEWSEIYRYESQYEIDLLVSKAINDPNELTDSEMYRLDDYYSMVMNAYFIRAMMQRSGLVVAGDVLEEAPFIVDTFFYYPVARAWLVMVDEWAAYRAPDLHRALAAAADVAPVYDSENWVDDWRNQLSGQ